MAPSAQESSNGGPKRLQQVAVLWRWQEWSLNALQPVPRLHGRLYVAQAFFLSGLT